MKSWRLKRSASMKASWKRHAQMKALEYDRIPSILSAYDTKKKSSKSCTAPRPPARLQVRTLESRTMVNPGAPEKPCSYLNLWTISLALKRVCGLPCYFSVSR